MKGAANKRRRQRGFSLLELIVVVSIIGVIAAMVTPSFKTSRDDHLAFDYARRYQQLLSEARSRAAGSGSAHLALLGPGALNRGFIRVYAALDGAAPGAVAPFNPVSSCKTNLTQWDEAQAITPPILNGNGARFVDHVDLNVKRTEEMDLRAELVVGSGVIGGAEAPAVWLAICVTPSGITYVGADATPSGAIALMRTSPAFSGIAEARIQRHEIGNIAVGLRRRVVISGGGSPRLRSDVFP